MTILGFLGIVDASGLGADGRPAAPPRQRKLTVESLEGRAVLTLFTPLVMDTVPGLVQSPPLIPPNVLEPITGNPGPGSPSGDPPQNPPPDPYGGSSGGEGGTNPSSGGDSGGGEGGDPPSNPGSGGGGEGGNPPPEETGAGSGSGTGEGGIPTIQSATFMRMGAFVTFAGVISDDGLLSLTVYFTTDSGRHFTAGANVLGEYSTLLMPLEVGTQVSFYVIDVAGNRSDSYQLVI